MKATLTNFTGIYKTQCCQYFHSRRQGEFYYRWMINRCVPDDVRLHVEYTYGKGRSMLTATRSFGNPLSFDLAARRTAVDDYFQLVCAGLRAHNSS